MALYLIPILIALTLIAAAAAFYFIQVRNREVSQRLKRVLGGEDAAGHIADSMERPLPVGLRLFTVFAWLFPGHAYSDVLYWELAQAGYRHLEARKVFAGIRVLVTIVFGAAGFLLALKFHRPAQEFIVWVPLAVVVGFFAPMMVVRYKQQKRQQAITLALPDALDLLVICVEAGQGLNAALLRVGRESELQARELAEELRQINNEMRAGITRVNALKNFAMRTGVDDVRALVAVMVQSDRFGTSISQALRTHAESLRIRRRQRAEEAARKAPVKLVFPLVFCIFPELLVVILAPGMLALFRALADMARK